MTLNYPRDEEDKQKQCSCGHRKNSHLTVNQTPAGPAYLYHSCRKSDCDCSNFKEEKEKKSNEGDQK